MSSLTAYPHHFDAMEPNPITSASSESGASMSKVMQSAQNIYLLSRVGTKRGLDQPALKRMLRELCDLESQLTTISPSSSPTASPRPSSPVADVCSSPSSPASPSTSSASSPSLSPSVETSSASSPARSSSAASSSSSANKRNIAHKNASATATSSKSNSAAAANNKKQLRRKAYVCSGCGASESSQWRNGPDGTKICNPCGMKFWRLKRKMMKRQTEELEVSASHNHAKASGGLVQLHQLRPQQQQHQQQQLASATSPAAVAAGLQHLHHLGAAAAAVHSPSGHYYAPHQQLFRPFHPGSYTGSFISNQSLHNQNDEEVMAAGMMMQHLRTASFSSVTARSTPTSSSSSSSSSFSSLSSPLSSLSSSSSSLSFSSLMSSPSSSPSPSPTPESESERKRSSIYDLLN